MQSSKKLGLIIGSLRDGSFNRTVAEYIVSQLPEHVQWQEIKIADLPLYNQDYDYEDTQPESYSRVRQQIKDSDAVLIVTPEHNRTMPAALKNVIDIASRPHGSSVWTDKKVALVTASPSTYGGRGSGFDFRKSMQALSAQVMVSPERYLSNISEAIEDGQLTSERTKKYLQQYVDGLVNFIGE